MGVKTRLLAASVALALVGVTGAAFHPARHPTRVVAETAFPSTTTSSTEVVTTTTTATTTPPPPPSTTAATAAPTTRVPVKAAAAPVTAPAAPVAQAAALRTNAALVPGNPAVFRGLGAWIDVYDWSAEFTGGKPSVGPNEVDHMADMGTQALYVQAAKHNSANDVVDPSLLKPIINRAHARGLSVIVWYLPTLEDPAHDLRRMVAISNLGVEGVGVDIESRKVTDIPERNRRLVDLSIAFRQRRPGVPISAVVMPAVVMEVINPNFWPGFPYRALAPAYDAWMPMDYWTNRTQASGYRDAYRYTAENIDRLRAQLGRGDLPVHPVGGIGDNTSAVDIDGFYRAASERHAMGGSIYDYRTTSDPLWSHLKPFQR